MKLIRSVYSSQLPQHGCVLTIGNFDAVHLGHQKIVKKLCAQGERLGLPVVLMTFEPQPEEYFRGAEAAARVTRVADRYFALDNYGIDYLLCLRFDKKLASTRAQDFISDVLFKTLNVKYLLVGDDFRFGAGREGDYSMLKDQSTVFGYAIDNFDTVYAEGERISSTRVRKLLSQGDLDTVKKLIGRPYSLVGRVVHGEKLGRQWGFPTLNLTVHTKPALSGIFAVRVLGLRDRALHGAAYIGSRPTVDGEKLLLEVHVFSFSEEVYGRRVCVEFVEKIREDYRFDSWDELKEQILSDSNLARDILEKREEQTT